MTLTILLSECSICLRPSPGCGGIGKHHGDQFDDLDVLCRVADVHESLRVFWLEG